jgi:hypothetical protein
VPLHSRRGSSWPHVSETRLGSPLFSGIIHFEQTGAIGVLNRTSEQAGCKIVQPHGNKPGSCLVWIRQRSIVDSVMATDCRSRRHLPRMDGIL